NNRAGRALFRCRCGAAERRLISKRKSMAAILRNFGHVGIGNLDGAMVRRRESSMAGTFPARAALFPWRSAADRARCWISSRPYYLPISNIPRPTLMRALTAAPCIANSARLEEVAAPPLSDGAVLVRTLALGVCGTDREIVAGAYGWAPPGAQRLIIGHESF